MSTIYGLCGPEVRAVLDKLLFTFRDDLVQMKMTIGLLFASSDNGEPVKSAGHPYAAKVKINGLSDRAEGKPDATITIDEARWEVLSAISREALLHHELTHLELKIDKKTGKPQRDDLGRPKLKMRLDDYMLTGFHEIVERYKNDALEFGSIKRVAEHWQGEYQLSLFDLVGAGAA